MHEPIYVCKTNGHQSTRGAFNLIPPAYSRRNLKHLILCIVKSLECAQHL